MISYRFNVNAFDRGFGLMNPDPVSGLQKMGLIDLYQTDPRPLRASGSGEEKMGVSQPDICRSF